MNQKFLLVVKNLHQYVKLDQALLRHHLLELDIILSKLEKSGINIYNLLLFEVPQTFIVLLTKDMDEHHGTQQERVNDDCSILLLQCGVHLNILFLSFQRMINL